MSANHPGRHFAVSHVWADGIVIPQLNKVYKCRLLTILVYLQQVRADRRR
jgi:hypothetical protein